MKQKQIILQNNIIDIYQKVLKNDKEKSLFLLKIFKFLLENEENFKANDKINGIFLAIKPSLKIKEFNTNWGGKREGSGRKINGSDNSSFNQDENQLDNQDENQDGNQDFSSSFKDIKNKSNKDNKDIKKENIKEKKELDLSFCDSQFLELINKWLKYKKEKKQSYTQMGIEMFYKKLLTLSNNNLSVASEIINNSIANNYAGIFELKNKSSNYNYCSQQDCPY